MFVFVIIIVYYLKMTGRASGVRPTYKINFYERAIASGNVVSALSVAVTPRVNCLTTVRVGRGVDPVRISRNFHTRIHSVYNRPVILLKMHIVFPFRMTYG